jgi:hypothetical protein
VAKLGTCVAVLEEGGKVRDMGGKVSDVGVS